ncbi:MAG: VWA domain-containing protein [Candidatus Promineofilum sp.]|nr:VWA domain-containing protein [Promineifilum sp.]
MDQKPIDLYTVLGIDRAARPEEIEAAFAAWKARSGSSGPIDDEAWQRVRYAYEVLISPQRRKTYDSLVVEAAGPALELDITLSAESIPLLDTPHILYALLTLRPRDDRPAISGDPRPLNLGLVIDRSTSMRGERLEKVTAAVGLLLDKLGPGDRLSLVSFSDRAEVVLPAATIDTAAASPDPETAAAWRDPRRRIEAIVASGGTEIYQGLQAGLAQVARPAAKGHISHLILLTDGHTYGDAADCLRLAEKAATHGVGITAFGLGADWNDAFLDALVASSGGQSHYIERPDDVLAHLESRLQGLGAIHARNLALAQSWPDSFTLRSAFKLAPSPQPLPSDSRPVPMGDLEGRSPMTVLLEFLVAPQSVAARFRLPFEVRFTAANGIAQLAERSARLVAGDVQAGDGQTPQAIIEAARWLNLYRMQDKAWEEAQLGKPDTAAARMRKLTDRYMETGDLRLARQAQLEAQQLAQQGAMSPEGRKVLKYGTRSLMRSDKS